MLPTITYCEQNISDLIAQPANSWSSLSYILIGFYLFYINRRQSNKLLGIFPISPVLIGIFSFIYHASYIATAKQIRVFCSQMFCF